MNRQDIMRRYIVTTIFLLNLGAIFALWWLGSSDMLLHSGFSGVLIAMGRVFGLLLEFFILVQLVLVSRMPFIERAYGFDVLNAKHRVIGYTIAATIVLHPLFLTLGYAKVNGLSYLSQFFGFLTNSDDLLNAFIGLLIVIAVGVIALPFIRKRLKYETWHASHLFIYVAIAFFFGHQTEGTDVSYGTALYYWFVLNLSVFGSFVFYRFLHPFIVFNRHRFFVEKVIEETHDVVSVYISGRNMERFSFESGQYVHVMFLAKGLWQPHPFSFSVAPNGKYIRLSIKAVGDYTSRVRSTLKPGVKVLLEGPLGRFTERAAARDKFLLIAGGIGITPIRSLLESFSKKEKDVVLIYGNKTEGDIVFRGEIESFTKRLSHVLSQSKHSEYEHGFIDADRIKRLAPDVAERDVYLCGPKAMMEFVVLNLKKLGVPSNRIHYEKFSY